MGRQGIIRRFRTATREYLSVIILPFLSALAGLRAGTWLAERFSRRFRWLFARHVTGMEAGYRRLFGRAPPPEFPARVRRYCFDDHTDPFTGTLYGSRYAARKFSEVRGEWPRASGFLALGFHRYGGGAVLDHLAANGHPPILVFRPFAGGSGAAALSARLRIRNVGRLSRGEFLPTGGVYDRIVALLRQGRVITGIVDAPPGPDSRVCEAPFFDRTVRLRRGLFQLAVETRAPVVFFYPTLNAQRRYSLTLSPARRYSSVPRLARDAGRRLEASVRQDPAGWQYFDGIDLFLGPGE